MPGLSMGGVLTIFGTAILLHTTWAVIQYRELLKITQADFESLPVKVLLELAVGTAIAILGAYYISGPLKRIMLPVKGRSIDLNTLRTDFISFNTRSRAMPLDILPIN